MESIPQNAKEFAQWSSSDTCGEFTMSTKQWYNINQANLFNTVQESDLAQMMAKCLENADKEYKDSYRSSLFAFDRRPDITWHKKPYESFLEKLYRINCIENKNYPDCPSSGWCTLKSSFGRIDDIVRTTLIVAYADAPPFLAKRITALAKSLGLNSTIKDHAKEKGYYAQHIYISLPLVVSNPIDPGDYPEVNVSIEIQVTTELQGALREVTHKLYEQERLTGGLETDWKTQFQSGRFRAAYMAHTLRFIEAMIVDLRDNVSNPDVPCES